MSEIKEDAPGNATGAAVAGTGGGVHWSKKQPRIGVSGKLKKYGQPILFKTLRRKAVTEARRTEVDYQHEIDRKKDAGTNESKSVYYKVLKKRLPAASRTSAMGDGSDGSESVQREHIVKVGSQYRLVSKSGGKNLGTYPTKSGAEKRERQVQYFKHEG